MSLSLSVELTPEVFQEYLEKDPGIGGVDVYFQLGQFAFSKYAEEESRLKTTGVEHGFNVLGRLIRMAAFLYPTYCEEQSRNKSAKDLKEILLDSKDTPGMFADIPSGANVALESQYSILGGNRSLELRNRNHYQSLFQFQNASDGSVLFVPVEPAFSEAKLSVTNQLSDGTLPVGCPMQELTREEIWPGMVSLAADTPEAFAHSLGIEDN